MTKSSNGIRTLKIWEILNQDSDEEHPLGTEDIRSRLFDVGIECDRRTIYADIELLNKFGYEVLKTRAVSNQYYVADRKFNVSEVLILLDAVQAASFITKKKTEELSDKIAQLAGGMRGEVLKRNIVKFNTVKNLNEHIYYTIYDVCDAITDKKKISFKYFDYDPARKRVYRTDKETGAEKIYVTNPLTTVFNSDNYYLLCYDDKHKGITQYRIDRMENVTKLDADITSGVGIEELDIIKYKNQLVGMFAGEVKQVTIAVDECLIDVVMDKFGENLRMAKRNGIIYATIEVQVSPTFIAWCCSFGDMLKVISPQPVVEEIKEYIQKLSYNYKNKKD